VAIPKSVDALVRQGLVEAKELKTVKRYEPKARML